MRHSAQKTMWTLQGLLTVDKAVLAGIALDEPLIEKIDIQIIKPHDHDRFTNAILDILPISAKALGKLGHGITHTLTGVYVMLTGVDSDGLQLSRYGVSYGPLKEHLCFGRAGTPSKSDFIISFDVTLAAGAGSTRPGPDAAHRACDAYCSLFRERLRRLDGSKCTERHDYNPIEKPGARRIAIVKQVPGQGAMFDTRLLPAAAERLYRQQVRHRPWQCAGCPVAKRIQGRRAQGAVRRDISWESAHRQKKPPCTISGIPCWMSFHQTGMWTLPASS